MGDYSGAKLRCINLAATALIACASPPDESRPTTDAAATGDPDRGDAVGDHGVGGDPGDANDVTDNALPTQLTLIGLAQLVVLQRPGASCNSQLRGPAGIKALGK